MATYSRVLLSGSTDGLPISVVATSSPGTTIHTAVAGTGAYDEVYLWAANTSSSAVALSVQWGSTSDPAGMICKGVSIPANSPPIPLVPGITLNNGSVVRAFAGTTAVINITGQVNRIS